MTDEPLPAALRRDRIAVLVQERGFIRVAELSRIFRTSPVTIRTDLDELASQDLVRRVHGGAVPTTGGSLPPTGAVRGDPQAAQRALLGAAAAELISSGQTVVLAGAPVTRQVAHALAARSELTEVVALTNDLHIAQELQTATDRVTTIVTGGTLGPDGPELGDPFGGLVLAEVMADLSIVGCGGISAERGLTATQLAGAELARRLLRSGDRAIVVAEADRVGRSTVARIAPAEDVDLLVTSAEADLGELARLQDRGVSVELIG